MSRTQQTTFWAVSLLVVVVLVWVSTLNLTLGLVAIGFSVFLCVLVALGAERMGIFLLIVAFFTAPMYKGLAPGGVPATPTDLCLVLGFALIAPRVLTNRVKVDPIYFGAGAFIAITVLFSAAISTSPGPSVTGGVYWIFAMSLLPLAIARWSPSYKLIDLLCWCYVVGHGVSTVLGLALNTGAQAGGRWMGMTTHPNQYAGAAMLSFCLCLHLIHRVKPNHRWIPVVALAASVGTELMSGSRGATIVMAVILLVLPIVERTAKLTALWLVLGASVVATLPYLVTHTSSIPAINRLTGGGSATGSDTARENGYAGGWRLFEHHPFFGVGLRPISQTGPSGSDPATLTLFNVHDNYLEVAATVGIFGLFAFLIALWALSRGLLGNHPMRRLCYTVLGYIGFGATIPSLYDRSIWVVVALAIVVSTKQLKPSSRWAERHTSPAFAQPESPSEPEPEPVSG